MSREPRVTTVTLVARRPDCLGEEPDADPDGVTFILPKNKLAAGGRRRPYLLIMTGLDRGTVRPVPQEGTIIGRSRTCDLVIQDDSVSRVHARAVFVEPENLVIIDLSSTNGVFLGEERVSQTGLKPGQRISLGHNTRIQYVFADETELAYHMDMYDSSIRDALTGLYNRRHIRRRLESDLALARRSGTDLSLLMIDVDDLKSINETHGRRGGDAVLVAIARRAAEILRLNDELGRFGAEEFAIIAPNTGPEGARMLADRIRAAVEASPIITEGAGDRPARVTVSVGAVTVSPEVALGAQELIARADERLRAAKEAGRNRTAFARVR